jgi:pyridoxamine 5'-phosphate oxidase
MAGMRDELRAVPNLLGSAPPPAFDSPPPRPDVLFADWFRQALEAGVPEPHDATLSTVDEDGMPDGRVLVLKDLTEDGRFAFAGGAGSAKGRQLAAHPFAALTFWWQPQARSVRLRGRVERASAVAAARDDHERGDLARAIALIGRQSEELADPSAVAPAVDEARARLERDRALTADAWVLWLLDPVQVEFWQAEQGRQHLRLQYARNGGGWRSRRLWP